MWSNVAESFNSWIREERHLPITKLIDSVRIKLMRKIAKRRELVNKLNGLICPKMESKLHDGFNTSRPWIVSSSGNDVYKVHSHPSVSVDISRRICSCGEWQLKGCIIEYNVAEVIKVFICWILFLVALFSILTIFFFFIIFFRIFFFFFSIFSILFLLFLFLYFLFFFFSIFSIFSIFFFFFFSVIKFFITFLIQLSSSYL
ncbi:hypothetical protein ACSBR2_015797 [Camellia fascicularis]